jgi:hypothetical protein
MKRIDEGDLIPNGISWVFSSRPIPTFKVRYYGALYIQWGRGEKRYRFDIYFDRYPGRVHIKPKYVSFIPERMIYVK